MEILAPAGSEESLMAAVFSGADTVYLAGKKFGARASAVNFTDEEIRAAVRFCRQRGVKVYITVNTLLKDSEMQQALDFVRFLCGIPADAVIVQDTGLFALLRKAAPELPLHASTQMSVHSAGGVRLVREMGAKRVVLARELSQEEILEISRPAETELEVFVHGALCMSVSGQCYFSAMLGSRSGNRGMCAQPCRLPFSVPGGTGHDLSLKDLCLIDKMDRLKEAGVCSVKIEGRMKRPEYVAAAVSAYRKAADGEAVPEEAIRDLGAVFSRSGFTQGYLDGKPGREMFGIRTKEDVQNAGGQVLSKIRAGYRNELKRVPVSFQLAEKDGGLTLTAGDGDGNAVSVSCHAIDENGKQEVKKLTSARCGEQLAKTGGTPFFAVGITVPEHGAAVQIAELNACRRRVLDKLLEARGEAEPIPCEPVRYETKAVSARERNQMKLRGAYRRAEQLTGEASRFEKVYLPLSAEMEELDAAVKGVGIQKENVILELPRALFGLHAERETKRRMAVFSEAGYRDFACGNLGSVQICREMGVRAHGLYSLNVTNSAALQFFSELGLQSMEVSFELTGKEIAQLRGDMERGVMIYGRQALMLTRNCPLRNGTGCPDCRGHGALKDRRGTEFPVICTKYGENRYCEVLNSVPLMLYDKIYENHDADFGICRFTVENPVECAKAATDIFQQRKREDGYTRGLFYRGIE